jgi:hypothetical protein
VTNFGASVGVGVHKSWYRANRAKTVVSVQKKEQPKKAPDSKY